MRRKRKLRVTSTSRVWLLENKVNAIVSRNRVRDHGLLAYIEERATAHDDPGFLARVNFMSKYTGYFRIVCGPGYLWVHDSEVIRV